MMIENTPLSGNDLMAIAKEEAVRRKELYDTALKLLKPIIDTVEAANQQGLNFSLHLYPPVTGSVILKGSLCCRPFHERPRDDGYYWYDFNFYPKTVECWISTRIELSEEAREYYERYDEEPEPEWSGSYGGQREPPLSDLLDLVREAGITALAEKFGGPSALKL